MTKYVVAYVENNDTNDGFPYTFSDVFEDKELAKEAILEDIKDCYGEKYTITIKGDKVSVLNGENEICLYQINEIIFN